jgi:hypothetical protein
MMDEEVPAFFEDAAACRDPVTLALEDLVRGRR